MHRRPDVRVRVVPLLGFHGPLKVAPVQAHHLVVQNTRHFLSGHQRAVLVVRSLVGFDLDLGETDSMSPSMRARTVSMSVSPGFWTTLMKLFGKKIHMLLTL